jgi:hypothetical protein
MISNTKHQEINFFAAIITIGNFIYSLSIVTEQITTPIPAFPIQGLPLGFILIMFLETLLASGFGYILVKFAEKGHGIPFMLFITVALISAWTTMFNIQWLIIQGSANSFGLGVMLAVLSAVFCGLACYFILIHSKDKKHIDFNSNEMVSINQDGQLIAWQIIAYIVMFVFVMSSQPY